MLTGNNRLNGFVNIIIILVALVVFVTTATSAQATAETTPGTFSINPAIGNDVLDGITLSGVYNEADVNYLRESLQLLREKLPVWAQYIQDAKPLNVTVDLNEGAHGRLAVARCCDVSGRGTITFGFHFGQSPDDLGKSLEARQVAFIGTLTHEATHVRDQREGRGVKVDRKSCITAERTGLAKQLEVKQALAAANLGGAYTLTLNQQIESESSALRSRELWDYYCGAFEN